MWNSLPVNVIQQANSDVFFDLCKNTHFSELTLCYSICSDHCVVKCILYEDDNDNDDDYYDDDDDDDDDYDDDDYDDDDDDDDDYDDDDYDDDDEPTQHHLF